MYLCVNSDTLSTLKSQADILNLQNTHFTINGTDKPQNLLEAPLNCKKIVNRLTTLPPCSVMLRVSPVDPAHRPALKIFKKIIKRCPSHRTNRHSHVLICTIDVLFIIEFFLNLYISRHGCFGTRWCLWSWIASFYKVVNVIHFVWISMRYVWDGS